MGHINTLMYTHLSALFFIGIGLCLIKGLVEKKVEFIFFAGILFGFNIFIRISNIAGLILIGILIYDYFETKDIFILLKNILRFFTGLFISSTVVVLTLCKVFGFKYFKNSAMIYINEGLNSTDGHSILDSIKINLNQGLNGIFYIILFVIIVVIINNIFKLEVRKNKKKLYYGAISIPVIFLLLAKTPIRQIYMIDKIYEVFYTLYQPFTIVVAFFGLSTVYFWFKKDKTVLERNQTNVYMFFLVIMMIMPMGSNQGFAILYQSFYIQSVLVVSIISTLLDKIGNYQFYKIQLQNTLVKSTCIFLLIYFLCMLTSRNLSYLYRDNIEDNMFSFSAYELEGVKTRNERINIIEEILIQLEFYRSDNKLITYGSIPLFSFLIDMPPFFDGFNGWTR